MASSRLCSHELMPHSNRANTQTLWKKMSKLKNQMSVSGQKRSVRSAKSAVIALFLE